MGYGNDDHLEFNERDIDLTIPLNRFESMLEYHGITKQEFIEYSNNQQKELQWNYKRFSKR